MKSEMKRISTEIRRARAELHNICMRVQFEYERCVNQLIGFDSKLLDGAPKIDIKKMDIAKKAAAEKAVIKKDSGKDDQGNLTAPVALFTSWIDRARATAAKEKSSIKGPGKKTRKKPVKKLVKEKPAKKTTKKNARRSSK